MTGDRQFASPKPDPRYLCHHDWPAYLAYLLRPTAQCRRGDFKQTGNLLQLLRLSAIVREGTGLGVIRKNGPYFGCFGFAVEMASIRENVVDAAVVTVRPVDLPRLMTIMFWTRKWLWTTALGWRILLSEMVLLSIKSWLLGYLKEWAFLAFGCIIIRANS